MSRRSVALVTLLVALAALAAAAAAACGGDDGDKESVAATQTAGAVTPAPTLTAAELTAIAEPQPTLEPDAATAVAAGADVELIPFEEPEGRYRLLAPKGWTVEIPNPDFVAFSLPRSPLTNLVIFCQPGEGIDGLMALDERIIANVARRTIISEEVTEAGGAPARLVRSVTTLSDLPLRNTTLYVEAAGCAWRFQLTTAAEVDYDRLFAGVVGSLEFP